MSINLQTGAVVNGVEVKRLWRLLVPVSGGKCGLSWMQPGWIQFLLQRRVSRDDCGGLDSSGGAWKDAVLFPCVGVSGLKSFNRNIGVGMKGL